MLGILIHQSSWTRRVSQKEGNYAETGKLWFSAHYISGTEIISNIHIATVYSKNVLIKLRFSWEPANRSLGLSLLRTNFLSSHFF